MFGISLPVFPSALARSWIENLEYPGLELDLLCKIRMSDIVSKTEFYILLSICTIFSLQSHSLKDMCIALIKGLL